MITSKDRHVFYNFCNELFSCSDFNIFILKTLSSRFFFKWSNLNFIILFVDAFYILVKCYKSTMKYDFIFMREFNTIPFSLFAFFLIPIRKKVLLNVNHNFQRASTSSFHRCAILFLDFLGFRFFCFEDSTVPFKLKNKIIEIPFLINSSQQMNTTNFSTNTNTNTIGVVGAIRSEKNIQELLVILDQLRSDFPNVNFMLGTDDLVLNKIYQDKGWITLDTTTYNGYISAINKADILIFNYSENAYRYRHSGVITDAIINNKIVIVPSYPYFVKQISNPVPIGFSFKSYEFLSEAIVFAIDLANSTNRAYLYNSYCDSRGLYRIVSCLDSQLFLL